MTTPSEEEDVHFDRIITHARTWGYKVNPERAQTVLKGLRKNYEKYGAPYCPCRLVIGDKGKDAAYICPCEPHHKEIEDNGQCKCNLYVKGETN